MFPYMTPGQVRQENERRHNENAFSGMNKAVRAELEARQADEAEVLPRKNQPTRSFGLRLLRVQRSVK